MPLYPKFLMSSKYLNSCLLSRFKILNRFSSKSSESFVTVEKNEKLQTATMFLQRPPVNSLNLELLQQITSSIKDLEKSGVKGFILASKSPSVFSAGLDIEEMYNAKSERFVKFWSALQEMWKTLYSTPLITMAAVNGHAPAGGCLLTISCDYRVMMDANCSIGLNETLLGLVAPRWFRDLYISTIGYRNAEKALYLGTLFSPQQALSLNIVDDLAASKEELFSKLEKQMSIWLKIPRGAQAGTKRELRQPLIQKLESYQDKEIEESMQYVLSENVQQALKKYVTMLKAKSSR